MQPRIPKSLRDVLSLTKHATMFKALDVSIIFESHTAIRIFVPVPDGSSGRVAMTAPPVFQTKGTWLTAAAWGVHKRLARIIIPKEPPSAASSFPFLDLALGEPNRGDRNLGLACSSESSFTLPNKDSKERQNGK